MNCKKIIIIIIIFVFIDLKKKKSQLSLFSIFVHKVYYFLSVIFDSWHYVTNNSGI